MRKYFFMKTTLFVQQLIKMWLFGSIQSKYKSFDAPERIQTKVLALNLPDTLPKIVTKICFSVHTYLGYIEEVSPLKKPF